MTESINTITIDATVIEKSALRYTPAGVAVYEAKCHYVGSVYEAGAMRQLEYDFSVMSFADIALRLDKVPLGQCVQMSGFIAPRSHKAQRLTVHITEFKI